jgi:hypothetical protein
MKTPWISALSLAASLLAIAAQAAPSKAAPVYCEISNDNDGLHVLDKAAGDAAYESGTGEIGLRFKGSYVGSQGRQLDFFVEVYKDSNPQSNPKGIYQIRAYNTLHTGQNGGLVEGFASFRGTVLPEQLRLNALSAADANSQADGTDSINVRCRPAGII